MRNAVVGALFTSILFSSAAFAIPMMVTGDLVVMPNTPSGEGNPNSIVCRAPQQLPGSDRLGPKSCGFNYEWAQLTATVTDRRMVANPTGKGNPDAVTCREPQALGTSAMAIRIQHYGPEICRTNRFWADLMSSRKLVAANGAIVPEPRWMPTIDTHLQLPR